MVYWLLPLVVRVGVTSQLLNKSCPSKKTFSAIFNANEFEVNAQVRQKCCHCSPVAFYTWRKLIFQREKSCLVSLHWPHSLKSVIQRSHAGLDANRPAADRAPRSGGLSGGFHYLCANNWIQRGCRIIQLHLWALTYSRVYLPRWEIIDRTAVNVIPTEWQAHRWIPKKRRPICMHHFRASKGRENHIDVRPTQTQTRRSCKQITVNIKNRIALAGCPAPHSLGTAAANLMPVLSSSVSRAWKYTINMEMITVGIKAICIRHCTPLFVFWSATLNANFPLFVSVWLVCFFPNPELSVDNIPF